MEQFYPVYLDLRGRKALVVGGGKVAGRKVKRLLNCGAQVVVISPALAPVLQELAAAGKIEYLQHSYDPCHLEGVFLVIGASSDHETNRRVAEDCFSRNIPVNIVDIPPLCSFYVPSLVSRGPLSIAISTAGKSPAFARLLREQLENLYGPIYGEFTDYLGKLRPRILREISDPQQRKALFTELAGETGFNLYKTLPPPERDRKIEEIIERYGERRQ